MGNVSDIHLVHEEAGTIHWKFANDGKYSASSAYKMQFEGLTSTTLECCHMESLGPSKVQFFCLIDYAK
jgi:hypothetical protein